jgi:hypothetical protein
MVFSPLVAPPNQLLALLAALVSSLDRLVLPTAYHAVKVFGQLPMPLFANHALLVMRELMVRLLLSVSPRLPLVASALLVHSALAPVTLTALPAVRVPSVPLVLPPAPTVPLVLRVLMALSPVLPRQLPALTVTRASTALPVLPTAMFALPIKRVSTV